MGSLRAKGASRWSGGLLESVRVAVPSVPNERADARPPDALPIELQRTQGARAERGPLRARGEPSTRAENSCFSGVPNRNLPVPQTRPHHQQGHVAVARTRARSGPSTVARLCKRNIVSFTQLSAMINHDTADEHVELLDRGAELAQAGRHADALAHFHAIVTSSTVPRAAAA